jgi:amidase
MVESVVGLAGAVTLAGDDAAAWRDAFRIIQSSEVWATHGAWVGATKPDFGPGIRERFEAAEAIGAAEIEAAHRMRSAIAARLSAMLPRGTLLLLPTSPGVAPLREASASDLEAFRSRALALLCPAGHAGLPQISLPLADVGGLPVGLSAIAAPGADADLLALAEALGAR